MSNHSSQISPKSITLKTSLIIHNTSGTIEMHMELWLICVPISKCNYAHTPGRQRLNMKRVDGKPVAIATLQQFHAQQGMR